MFFKLKRQNGQTIWVNPRSIHAIEPYRSDGVIMSIIHVKEMGSVVVQVSPEGLTSMIENRIPTELPY